MNGALREKLMRNRFAGKIVSQVKTLAENGIEMHCQAVIVPYENDGDELAYTARQLFQYYPTVRDLACVPTGLTKYRDGLHPIPDVDKAYSERLLDLVDSLNAEFGVPFLLPADEYFVKAEREVKDATFYGDFSQIENGVGLTRKFLDDAYTALDGVKASFVLKKPKKSLLVCGMSAARTTKTLVEDCNKKIGGLQAELLPVKNAFFGETVTCTGLLTGEDIALAVEEYREKGGEFDELVLAGNTMKEFEDVFLCGMTLAGLKARLGMENIRVNRDGGRGFVEILVGAVTKRR
jgi:NifB/MoaA-like Fe-S oxidoreductase